jgi:hypothetical protein
MSDTFVDRALQGRATLDDIDDFVDAWHEGDDPRELHEFLGLTWDEYALWGEQPDALRYILAARWRDVPVAALLRDYASDLEPAMARARDETEAREVLAWLEQIGRTKKS